MSEKKECRDELISSNDFHVPLENGKYHLEIQCDIMAMVVVRPPPPRNPNARVLVVTNHDLGFGYSAVIQVLLVEGPVPRPEP